MTVILEILAVVNISKLKETMKLNTQNLISANFYNS